MKNSDRLIEYNISSFFQGLVFYAPVALLVRTSRGITLREFFLLQVILSTVMLVGEIPTGKIVDRMGYKKSIIISGMLLLIARSFFLFSDTFILFAIEAVLEGVSFCVLSGTDSAYLYSVVGDKGYKIALARLNAFGTAGFIMSTILFMFLYPIIGLQGLILGTCITTLISIVVFARSPIEGKHQRVETTGLNDILNNIRIQAFPLIIDSSILGLGCILVNFFFVSKIISMGLKTEFMTPIILCYSLLKMSSPTIINYFTGKNFNRYGIISIVTGVLFVGLYFIQSYIVVIVMEMIPILLEILIINNCHLQNIFIDENQLSSNRATTISVFRIVNDILEIGFLIMAGLITDSSGVISFLVFGVLVIVYTLFRKIK